MPITSRGGVDLYYETVGRGPALLLLHGFFGSSQDWYEYGYVSAFSSRFRVIAPDSRGHGKSGKPLQPEAYGISQYAQDVNKILQASDVAAFHLIGFSDGARIGFALSNLADIKMASFVCIGGHPFAEDMGPTREGVRQLGVWPKECGVSINHQKRLLTNDREALAAAAALDRPEERIDKMTMPTLIVAGLLDEEYGQFARTAALLPNAKLLSFERINHVESLTRTDLVLPVVLDFINQQAGACPE